MDIWIDLTEDPGHGEQWQEAQQGTQYTQTPAEEWRNKKRPAASYTELSLLNTSGTSSKTHKANETIQTSG